MDKTAKPRHMQGFVLEGEALDRVRRAVLIGLASYGEIERLSNAQQIREACSREVPEDLRVLHPTGAADTTSDFAAALLDLEYAMRKPA